jgi:hypothetical protein
MHLAVGDPERPSLAFFRKFSDPMSTPAFKLRMVLLSAGRAF